MSEEHRLITSDALLERCMDLSDLLARVDNDRELLTELLMMFRDELPGLHSELHDAIVSWDQAQAAKSAHTLKGMLANMSMRQGATLAADVEMAARAGDISVLKNTLASFDSEVARLSAAVDAFIQET